MKNTLPTAKYRHPKTKTKKLWVGSYGGHYEALFFFKKKPKLTKDTYGYDWFDEKYYCIVENKDLVAGSMYLGDFEILYPDFDISLLKPEHIEITKVIQIMFEAVYDDYGNLVDFSYNAEN